MHHIFRHVPARELPEQSPVDKAVRIEWPVPPAVQECTPVNVLGSAVGGDGTHPLAFSVGSVPAHPRFYLRDLAEHPVIDPLSCILQRAGTFPLQSDLDD